MSCGSPLAPIRGLSNAPQERTTTGNLEYKALLYNLLYSKNVWEHPGSVERQAQARPARNATLHRHDVVEVELPEGHVDGAGDVAAGPFVILPDVEDQGVGLRVDHFLRCRGRDLPDVRSGRFHHLLERGHLHLHGSAGQGAGRDAVGPRVIYSHAR